MNNQQQVIIIIPARGGSKGIPRKNLRPLAGFPLIYYSIQAALGSVLASRVVVSTDDDEISLFAERFGAEVVTRSAELANDSTTLDPVILDAATTAEAQFGERYDIVVTVQPTSPLVRAQDIDRVIGTLMSDNIDTALTVVDDRHLRWHVHEGQVHPSYKKRVNRQSLPLTYRETGAVIACHRDQLMTGTRIGERVGICEMPHERSFDIDTYADLYLCEALLSRKKIVLTVVGYAEVGLGHAYRAVMLAHELVQYQLVFVCEERSDLAISYISSNNYEVVIAKTGALADAVVAQKPDLVINDVLDTSVEYMQKLVGFGIPCVNFEDMGPGHKLANLVVNALYPDQDSSENVLVGPRYFCLRDEFIYLDTPKADAQNEVVKRVLVTFGGVDEGDLTAVTVKEIAQLCAANGITIDIVTGPGYSHKDRLDELLSSMGSDVSYRLVSHTKRISEFMSIADVAITSAGRTVLELAALSVPMIVICQNQRETTHTFASANNGIVNLGNRSNLAPGDILSAFAEVVSRSDVRNAMIEKMKRIDLRSGKSRVIGELKSLLK